MGIHQYGFDLVPKASLANPPPVMLTNDDLEAGQDPNNGWWSRNPPSARVLAELRTLLPTNKSWGETEEYASAGDWHSDVRIWKEGNRVWSIGFRFSPTSDQWPLLQKVLSLARMEQCLLREHETGAMIEPNDDTVQERLAASHAMRFARNPTETLAKAGTRLDNEG